MRSNYRKKLDDLNLKLESLYRMYSYRKKAKIRLNRMNGGYIFSNEEYEKEILSYWKKYQYKPKKFWYSIYCDREKKLDPRYIPDDLYYGLIVPYFSNSQFRRFGEDKCMHDLFFRDLNRPQTIVKNMAGVYYNQNMKVINEKQAIEICSNYGKEFLIKPSIDSGEARLISFVNPNDEKSDGIKTLFKSLRANFVVQEVVMQHNTLKKLNDSSLNTIRVVSFFFEGEVYILSSILRMGASGERVDNIGAGGFACRIKENGQLNSFGVNRKAEWVSENQHGIKFSDVKVPGYDKLLDIIKNKHKYLPHFKIIGWDFAVDQEGDPVFIEYNSCPGSNQITCGPTFGDITDRVLEEIFIKKTLKNAQN